MSERFELPVNGLVRSYRLHRPASVESKVPLVVFLHGKGGTAEWAEDETGWSRFADQHGFAVLYPEALPRRLDREPKFLTNPPTWHDGSPNDDRSIDDVAYLKELLHTVQIESTSVYLTGFSNGAAMAFRLASEMPTFFSALAPVAGYCWIEPQSISSAIPTLYLLGDSDPLIPLNGGKVVTPWRTTEDRPVIWPLLERWSEANRFVPRTFEIDDDLGIIWRLYASTESETPFRIGVIARFGHHWPGGKAGLGEKLGGPFRETPSANELLWEFFQSMG
jgi:polyhydroxybutyrate depolymerase